MLNPIKAAKNYFKQMGPLGRHQTPVSYSHNEVAIRRIWPDGTWNRPIPEGVDLESSMWRHWDGKRWVVNKTVAEQKSGYGRVMDQQARKLILDTFAQEEINKNPGMEGRLHGLHMESIPQTWRPSYAVMQQVVRKLGLQEDILEYIAQELRNKALLRP